MDEVINEQDITLYEKQKTNQYNGYKLQGAIISYINVNDFHVDLEAVVEL